MKRKDTRRRWRPGLLLGVALGLALGALALAGCGGGSSSSSPESSSTTGTGPEASGGKEGAPGGFDISEEQRSCLKEKGIELPEFKGGGEGGPPEGFEPPEGGGPPQGGEPPEGGFQGNSKAFEECGVELGGFKGPGGKGGPNVNSASFKKQVKEYVACVRENGYELAEPNFSGEGPIFEKSESESAAFKKASASCQSLLGGPGGGAGPGAAEEE
jgi:hypothetical protein